MQAPEGPADFMEFWQARYAQAQRQSSQCTHLQFNLLDFSYLSTDDFPIQGWLVLPRDGQIQRGIIVGHGYGGRQQADLDLPIPQTAFCVSVV